MESSPDIKPFLEFLVFSLNPTDKVPSSTNKINWQDLLTFAKKQCIVGIYWYGINHLPQDYVNKPDEDDVMEWMGEAVKLQRRGEKLDEKTVEISNILNDDGFENCILKGQTNNRFYPSPYIRTPGDIDVWVDSKRTDLLHYILRKCGTTDIAYHHFDFPIFKDVPAEVHIKPIYSANPFKNYKLQKFFRKEFKTGIRHKVKLVNGAEVNGLTDKVNLLFQLMHMHKHLCTEGLGLRQVIDFYYLLNRSNLSANECEEVIELIKKFHLLKFACGIMYILHTILGYDGGKNLVQEDSDEGKYILEQILQGGNFGKYDTRLTDYKQEPNHFLRFIKLMRLLLSRWSHDPYEVSWQPLFFIVNWFMIHWYKRRYNF